MIEPVSAPSSSLAARRGWVRLSPEAWSQIRAEYGAGATGAQLATKWGVSRNIIYDHASKEGWTKRDRGLAISVTVLEETRAAAAQRALAASRPPAEADALSAVRVLIRRGAASALAGAGVRSAEELRMAADLLRVQRLLTDAEVDAHLAALRTVLFTRQTQPSATPPA